MLEDTKKYFANFDGTTNCCRTIALWITAALLLAFAVKKIYTLILFKKSQKYDAETAKKINSVINGAWLAVALTVAAAFIITFTACYFTEVAAGDEYLVPILFYLLLVCVVAAVASAAAIALKPVKLT